MHTNIDYAIASVIERGQDLTIPNVFAAYLQGIAAYGATDGVPPVDTDAISRAALVSFERAMDKYPMPSLPAKTKTKTKAHPISKPVISPSDACPPPPAAASARPKMYSVEVAQLRWDYQQAVLRSTTNYDPGCACISCSLLALREKAALLAEKVDDLEQQLANLPVRKRRARKVKRSASKKKAPYVPVDPYAPSTSTATV